MRKARGKRQKAKGNPDLTLHTPHTPDSRFPIPDSRFPIPDSLLPHNFVTKVFKICYNKIFFML
ncbi:hypothetical protein [Moorena producens]|uniref:hypothetical protein n=1 Tax=Moorena producens TaxID=1155739 RepID=UPI003C758731